jgi:lipoprotein signal peptidase
MVCRLAPSQTSHGVGLLCIHPVKNQNPLYRSEKVRAAMSVVFVFAAMSVVALHFSGKWFQSGTSLLGFGLAFGGAAGNLLDIWRYGSVLDFIQLGWWPAFNLADVGIVAGLLLAFWY